MDGDGRLQRRGADAVDVVRGWNERVEVARLERAALDEPKLALAVRVDLLVLRPAVKTDDPPSEMVVHRCLRIRRDDQRKERERAVVVPAEQPLPDPAAHP